MSFLHCLQEKSLIGIDITPNQVRMVELAKCQSGFRMLGYAQNAIEEAANRSGGYYQHSTVIAALQETLAQLKPRTRQAVIAVDHTAVIFKSLALDASLQETDILALIRKHASQYFHLEQQELLLDFTILSAATTPGLINVRWVAAKRRDVDTQIAVLAKLGLAVSRVEVSSFALQRTMTYFFQQLTGDQPVERIVLIYIGVDALFMGIFQRDHSVYVLAEHYALLPGLSQVDVISPFIQRGLQAYVSTNNPGRLDGIFLAGDSVNKSLAELIQKQSQINTYLSDPLGWFGEVASDSSAFLLSIGLAMNR